MCGLVPKRHAMQPVRASETIRPAWFDSRWKRRRTSFRDTRMDRFFEEPCEPDQPREERERAHTARRWTTVTVYGVLDVPAALESAQREIQNKSRPKNVLYGVRVSTTSLLQEQSCRREEWIAAKWDNAVQYCMESGLRRCGAPLFEAQQKPDAYMTSVSSSKESPHAATVLLRWDFGFSTPHSKKQNKPKQKQRR